MDEGVWVLIGILSVIIGLVIVANMIVRGEQDLGVASFESALDRLAHQCNQVCRLPQDSAVSVRVDLREGLYLYTQEDLLCGEVAGDLSCRRCNCDFGVFEEQLNLTGSPLRNHEYECRFTKGNQKNIAMECQG